MRPDPHPGVIGWVRRQRPPDLFFSAVTLGELVRGVVRLPAGERRRRLEAWVSELLPQQFEGRILAFDQKVAVIWGEFLGTADRAGRPPAAADAQIAATARRHDLVLVTRNIRDFQEMNVALLDPWQPPQA